MLVVNGCIKLNFDQMGLLNDARLVVAKQILGMRCLMIENLGSNGYLKKYMLKGFFKDLTWARKNLFVLHLQAILNLVLSIVLQVRKRSKKWEKFLMLQELAIWCTRLDIAHVVGVVNWFLSNLGKDHRQRKNGFSNI